jgi:CheY-like chemotaxis protein
MLFLKQFLPDNLLPMYILYADDDIDDFFIFVEITKVIDPGIFCMNAQNGLELLDILENATILPDAIFLDINMPSMDGKSCLRVLKRDTRFRDIPVVMYTTSTNPEDDTECRELGADDYLRKPVSVVDAARGLKEIFRQLRP